MRIAGLSLHHLTALDATPLELVDIAGGLGCEHVSLFTFVPPRAASFYPKVTAADVPALREAMDATGVTLANLDVFPLDGEEDWDEFARALDAGAALGATSATVQPHGVDPAGAAERIARFCDLAAPFGIVAGLEFTRFCAIPDIGTAAEVIRQVERPDAAITLDMLHLVRAGDGAAAVPPAAELVRYVQLCDGPLAIADDARWHEAVRERGLPGDGEFPIVAALQALDPTRMIFDAEVPQTQRRKAGVSAADRARLAIDGARAVLRAAFGPDAA